MKLSLLTIAALALLYLACSSDEGINDGGNSSPNSGILVTIDLHGTPEYMKPMQVSFTYWVDPESGWETPDTVVAKSYIRGLPAFEVLSGDTAWTDTLAATETRTHEFVIRPRYYGTRIQCASVAAFIDSALTIAGGKCREITVR